MRQFTPGPETARYISFGGEQVPFGPQILFEADEMDNLIVAAEICEDVWSPVPPSIRAAIEGATVIVNCSASDETIGKDTYRRELISGQVRPSDFRICVCQRGRGRVHDRSGVRRT